MFDAFQSSFAKLMRQRLAEERRVRGQRISSLKTMLKSLDSVMTSPGSKAAARRLKAVRGQLAGILQTEVAELEERIASNREVIAKLRHRE